MSALDCVVGIDLGSTTTKAVILDDTGGTLGRGITNSRSNYDVACAVARSEALVDARVQLVRRALDAGFAERAAQVLELIDKSFREAQHRAMLRSLRAALLREVANHRHDEWRRTLESAVGEILETMDAEAASLFEPGAEKRSDFFRDLASSSYMRHAEERQDPKLSALRGAHRHLRQGHSHRRERDGGPVVRRACRRRHRTGAPHAAACRRRAEPAGGGLARRAGDRAARARRRRHRLRPCPAAVCQGTDPQRDPLPRPRRPRHVPGHRHRARHRRPGHQGHPGRRATASSPSSR